jgi:hypothetical protein
MDQHLTSLEIASCVVVGPPQADLGVAGSGSAADPVAELERAVVCALRRPPCLVSFSGGHDSSLVLAAAVRAAQRERLPAPVPVTWRVRDAPAAGGVGLAGSCRARAAGFRLDPAAGR